MKLSEEYKQKLLQGDFTQNRTGQIMPELIELWLREKEFQQMIKGSLAYKLLTEE